MVDGPAGEHARTALGDRTDLRVPAIFTAEITSAVRRMHLRAEITDERAQQALGAIATVRTTSYPFEPFLDRVWQLRTSMTVYDAWYVALAESLATSLVTADGRLARSDGALCPVLEVAEYVIVRRDPPPPSAP